MIKETITYTDFNGDMRIEDFYFNLSVPEVIKLEAKYNGGLSSYMEEVSKSGNAGVILEFLTDFILHSYGVKSEDGRRFIKSDEATEDFSQSEAFSELLMRLFSDANKASNFINNLIPKQIQKFAQEQSNQVDKVSGIISNA